MLQVEAKIQSLQQLIQKKFTCSVIQTWKSKIQGTPESRKKKTTIKIEYLKLKTPNCA